MCILPVNETQNIASLHGWNGFNQYFVAGLVVIRAGHEAHGYGPFFNAGGGSLPAKRTVVGLALLMRNQIGFELSRIAGIGNKQGFVFCGR